MTTDYLKSAQGAAADGRSSIFSSGSTTKPPLTISSDNYQFPPEPPGPINDTNLDETIYNLQDRVKNMPDMPQPAIAPHDTQDNMNNYPDLGKAQKYSMLIANFVMGKIPKGEFDIDSPTMKNIIEDYQEKNPAFAKYNMMKMQDGQPGYAERHPDADIVTKGGWDI